MRSAHAAWHLRALLTFGLLVASATSLPAAESLTTDGMLPTAADGRPLNLDFETGTLADWTATGEAFAKQPIEGDTVAVRKRGSSVHQGKFWLGGYEKLLDKPTGTLTSAPFRATQPWAGLRIGGGGHRETRVEVVCRDNGEIVWSGSGRNIENLEPVAIDLRAHQGKELFVRIVDEHTGHWGHINFDDFRLYASKPNFPDREPAKSISGGQPVAAKGQAPSIPPDDLFKHNGLSPEAAAKAMTLPEGFQATLFAGEPDVQQPIAMALDDRGRLWVAEAYSYPIKVKPEEARDRVLIFEDADGDGRFDSRKVFIDKLNLVSGLELGFGGVYIGAAPELLFVPDADGDDRPDGPPQVLLDGWGSQDTHETLNSFIWGPDGWLYGCHGVFTHSRVGKPGTPDDKRTPLNAGIWRYHPVRHEFEVFAQGTSNPWGVDFNDRGEAFLTACVIPHLFHVIQNGRYHRQAGSHFNPYTYDDIKTIAKHRHWIGATPHAGNNKSDSGGGGHAHSGAMIYLGGKWPAKYRDQIFMNNIHGARLNQDQLAPHGSGYVGDRAPDFLLSNDSWSQILYFTYGPDGDMWMIDWYDRQQCHRREIDVHDRSNGRIFRVTYGKPTTVKVDLKKLSDLELAEQVLNPNDWYVRHARRILQERAAVKGAIELDAQRRLVEVMTMHPDDTRRLRALWAWHVTGGGANVLENLIQGDPSEHVKGWCIRLACDAARPLLTEQQISNAVYPLKSPVVRRYIASVLPKFHHSDRFQFLLYLLKQADDASDHNLPLLYWYAAESIVEHNPYLAATLLFTCRIDSVRAFLVRRLAQQGDPEVFELILGNLPTEEPLLRLTLRELTAGLQGARRVAAPPSWGKAYAALATAADGEVRELADGLGLTFGDAGAVDKLTRVALDGAAPLERRQAALTALLKARVEKFIPQLQVLLGDKAMRGAALRGMAAYDDPAVPQTVLGIYASLTPAEKRDALGTLSARVAYGQALLDAVAAGTVPRADLSADLIRQLRNLKDAALEKRIVEVWGNVNDTPEERLRLIREYQRLVTAPHPKPADKQFGRAVFAKACAQCHTLFGTGGKIGPELTGSNRANLDYLLSNILDPSALIGRDYIPHVLETSDGRVLTGLVRDETPTSLTLVTATETLIVPKNEIDSREASKKSMMPEDILKPLSDDEVRGLLAYLATPAQVPMAATVENAKSLFNGRDLTGWTGNRELWSVENGELVGRTTSGLAKNEFLVSELAAGDFRLTLEVKLVDNRGNSGVQFRSVTETSGSVRGYQADVGPGWWGKLYEEHGRGLLWPAAGDAGGEKHLRSGEWNTYEITAVGSRVQTKLNGRTCVDLADPSGTRTGVFALQLHSGGPTEVRYRNLKLELNPKWDFSSAFDSK